MTKPKTLRARANAAALVATHGVHGTYYQGAFINGYVVGHRAGSRLTKAERKVIEAATAYMQNVCPRNSDAIIEAAKALQSKEVRK